MSGKVINDYWCITCKCGYTAPHNDFSKTPINGELPKHHYQCPVCKVGWSIKPVGLPVIDKNGFIIPPENRIEIEVTRL